MKYFVVEQDKRFIHAPQIVNWFDKIDMKKLKKETQEQVPFRTTLKLRSDKEVQFTDIITHPCLGFSEQVKSVLIKFEPNLEFKEVMVYDPKYQNTFLYYLPILDEVDCLTEHCVYNLDRSKLEKIEINEGRIRDKSIFNLAGVKSRYTVMRLDLVEALLRRNISGLMLNEITVTK